MKDKVSFLEGMNINQMVIDATYQEIGEQLVEDWVNSNLDEGQYYADMQFAHMSGDPYLQKAFNEWYELTPEDDDYFEVEA